MSPSSILVVDDTEAHRYSMSRILARAGFQVAQAETGARALEVTRTLAPAVVVLDVNLPDVNGFDVCRRLRNDPRTAGVGVLHVSASYVEPQDRVRGLEGGADGYLVHPVNPDELVATVRALIRARRSEARLEPALGEALATAEPATAVVLPWVSAAVASLAKEAEVSPAECLVIEQAIRGLSNKEIARVLGISASTVRGQLLSASRKLDVSSRGELSYLVFCESHRIRTGSSVEPKASADR